MASCQIIFRSLLKPSCLFTVFGCDSSSRTGSTHLPPPSHVFTLQCGRTERKSSHDFPCAAHLFSFFLIPPPLFCMSGNPGCSVPSSILPSPSPTSPLSSSRCWSDSQRRLVHVDHLVILQCCVWAWLAEEEPKLHQPHAAERRHVL